MDLRIKRTHPDAQLPAFQTEGAACFDISCVSHKCLGSRTRIYKTGLSFDIPKGYDLEACVRSGLAFKGQFILTNGVAIIDEDFTGELKLSLTYVGDSTPYWPRNGDRIAQARLIGKVETNLIEVEKIEKQTERGGNGLGSTGV
jgi:dUTP pyrophosphatase